MTKKQLEDYLWGAANILRGMIDAADFKQYIFPLLFFKRISDVWDEEYQQAVNESGGDLKYAEFREQHWFDIPKGCHWDNIRDRSEDVGKHLQFALRKIENANLEQLCDIFGDAQWTNKKRLSDEKMRDLIEHFSKMDLSVKNIPHDIMGEGYEYLIKKFADDSGHTAAEFYTNRTVVKLMTMITDPKPGESVYDPTCGSGGILLNSALHLKEQKKEYRNLKLYGQELNLITSAIARMNMFMHNVEEFKIVQGDTLDSPQLLHDDELRKFDVIMANPPYSVKRWNQKKFMNDPFGRNIWGTPPQGCADYAFQQHIIKSLKSDTGRCVVLWPHGVLFRDAESGIRTKMIEEDKVDAVIGLGKNLFYNSSMESCLLICRMKKPKERKGKIIFINAVNEVRLDRSNAWLEPRHIKRISDAYWKFKAVDGFARVINNNDVLKKSNCSLNISLYVANGPAIDEGKHNIDKLLMEIKYTQNGLNKLSDELINKLTEIRNLLSENGFERVRFDQIAFNISERVEPKETNHSIYVGLEHLDADNLKIERRGRPEDVIGTKLKIHKGDIIFGKRRAYLRKVAVSDFDGIVSAHSMVLRANEKNIEKEFLPYFMQSDEFMNRAVQISEGSLSPTIKWKTLAQQEFNLPKKEKQGVLVEVFKQFDEIRDQLKTQKQTLQNLKQKLLNEILG